MHLASLLGILIAVSASGASGCGDDDPGGVAAAAGPPNLRIDDLVSPGVGKWKPGTCLQIGSDPDGTVLVVVGQRTSDGRLRNFTLSSYGGCNGAPNCGVLFVTVIADGEEVHSAPAAGTTVAVPLGNKPLKDVPYTFRVQLLDEFGTPLSGDGGTYEAEEVVDQVRAQCFGPGPRIEGGADAARDGSMEDGGVPQQDASADALAPDATADGAAPDAATGGDASLDGSSPDVSVPVDAGADAAPEAALTGG